MSNCECPLTRAAVDAPSSLALIGRDFSLTFKELELLSRKKKFQEGQVVKIDADLTPETIATFFAAWRQNASVMPVNPRIPQKEIPFEKQYQKLLLYTSGSTGTPKIAVLSFKALLTSAKYSVPLMPDDCWLLSLPLYHVAGIGIILRCMLARATIALDSRSLKITHLSCVPTQLYRMSPVYKNLKCILLGGAPPSTIPNNLPIFGTYGLTEMSSMVLLKENPKFQEGHLFLGLPLPKRELKIADDGEILVRGETLFDGYLGEKRDPKKWLKTGDIGLQDPREGVAIIGRKDFQFISGGENIQPEEIEKYIRSIPEILDAVVLPKKDPEYGMRPVAVIHSKCRISLKSISKHLKNYLPNYKIPIALYSVGEFPKKGMKTDRHQLKKILDLSSLT